MGLGGHPGLGKEGRGWMVAGRREGTEVARGLRFGVGFFAPGSLQAHCHGARPGLGNSEVWREFLHCLLKFFCLRESEVFFLLVCFVGFWVFFFLSLPYLAPLSYSFLFPDLHWSADISCPGIVIPFLIAAFGTRSAAGSGLLPGAAGRGRWEAALRGRGQPELGRRLPAKQNVIKKERAQS